MSKNKYDIIVIGAGHAGIEAALASAKMGCSTLMVTLGADTVGLMSCNPAIGGVGKGQLVKEIDALGGHMGIAADKNGMQFRILNASKGPAVQSSRAQIDKDAYNIYMRGIVGAQKSLELKESRVTGLLIANKRVEGIITEKEGNIEAGCVIIAAGTFLGGLIHVGLTHFPGGRLGEPSSEELPRFLTGLGFTLKRFKTGTCPRLDKKTIDFSRLTPQYGDVPPMPFSFSTVQVTRNQFPCYITHTNKATHEIIKNNLSRSPLYSGIIKATGVRYCPSIEDKIIKFSDRERHQIFLEPEGVESDLVYPNGVSTSLPEEVQLQILRSISGLEDVKVVRFGYGIEHTVIDSTQLYPTLEAKVIQNLYFAGQVNGTTGYEEAAAQGLIAGVNAALRIKKTEPLILDRSSGYIGVLIDDLVTKGTNEPYRMFTSRVEYRLIAREDNADIRLGEIGFQLGLLSRERYAHILEKKETIKKGIELFHGYNLRPSPAVNEELEKCGVVPLRKPVTAEELLKRPQVDWSCMKRVLVQAKAAHIMEKIDVNDDVAKQIEIEIKYSGFIERQLKEVERFKHLEKIKIPFNVQYECIPNLSREIREKLSRFKPLTLGQASRISGVTPVSISLLMIYLRKTAAQKEKNEKNKQK